MVILPMGMTARQTYLADSHPSLNASMEDFEDREEFSPTIPDLPSQHSGFRSNQGSEYSERSEQHRSYSPPIWRKRGSGWFKPHPELSPQSGRFGSHDPSPQYHSVHDDAYGDVSAWRTATDIPLPVSPAKGRSPSHSPQPFAGAGAKQKDSGDDTIRFKEESPNLEVPAESNYIRFSSTLAVQQRTDGIDAVIFWIRKTIHRSTKSRYSTFVSALVALFCYWLLTSLFSTPTSGPVPDLVKVAGLAKSFEPVIYYSENGYKQIGELQDTGVAVWDLSESVRNTNMTSAPMIVNQLEDLSESLNKLSTELTSFFAGLDADVDAILLVMEWAGRELSMISTEPQSTLSAVWSNTHTLLTRAGLVSSDSQLVKELVGQTTQQRTRAALERTFTEFLNVLEESIANELEYSARLFAFFESIDRQFLNLHRTVIREQDTQERIESDVLSSLWTRVVGGNASKLRKYEKNKNLLQSVRNRTMQNKSVLGSHTQRLQSMKSDLERLRQRLVSPLVRNTNSSSLSVDDQIRGLEGTYNQLKSVRETQKSNKMALVYGTRDNRNNHLEATERMIYGKIGQTGQIEGRLR